MSGHWSKSGAKQNFAHQWWCQHWNVSLNLRLPLDHWEGKGEAVTWRRAVSHVMVEGDFRSMGLIRSNEGIYTSNPALLPQHTMASCLLLFP